MELYRFRRGRTPLLVSMPHTGTFLPEWLEPRLTRAAKALPDTDWHLEPLYDFLGELGASVLVATQSRYVVDLNRSPDNANLYPGQDTTGVVPLDTFHKQPLYIPGFEPSAAEISERITSYWKPYHAKLAETLASLKSEHGYALLWDAHSILSVLPRFFAGKLTNFNLGTADGKSCAPGIGEKLAKIPKGYSVVLNGRFKGGYITRAYGDPSGNVHAVQLELSEAIYMEEEPPFRLREPMAAKVRPHLKELLKTFMQGFAPKA